MNLSRSIIYLLIFATLGSCHDRSEFSLNPTEAEQFLSFGPDTTAGFHEKSLPADQLTTLTLLAQITARDGKDEIVVPDSSNRAIIFTTDKGTLIGGKSTTTGGKEVPLDDQLMARIMIKSSDRSVGTALVTAQVRNVPELTRVLPIEFEEVEISDLISFLPGSDKALVADGLSEMAISVQVDQKVPRDQMVRFTATKGSLSEAANDLTEDRPIVGDVSTVTLRSPTDPGITTITAMVSGFSQTRDLMFIPVVMDSMIRFIDPTPAEDTSLIADGLTSHPVQVKISNLIPTIETVRFTLSGGGSLSSTPNDANEERPVVGGKANILLESPRSPGTVRITASILNFTSERVLQFIEVPDDNILRFLHPSKDEILQAPADGDSTVTLSIFVTPEIPSSNRDLVLETTDGAFLPESKTKKTVNSADDTTVVLLRAPHSPGVVQVSAAIHGVTQQIQIQYLPALPERIVVVTSDFTVQPNGSVTVTGRLIRENGQVTPDTEVRFTAVRTDIQARIGRFTPTSDMSNATQEVETTFSPGGTSYRGDIKRDCSYRRQNEA